MEEEITESFHSDQLIEETVLTNHDEAVTMEEADTNEVYENVNFVSISLCFEAFEL
mgnify:CR=1 FL=1